MQAFWRLFLKDVVLEFRSKESFAFLLSLAVLLSLIVAVGINNAYLPPATVLKLFSPLIWIISVFAATLAIGRSYEYELENMALEGLVLSGASPSLIFLAKTCSNFLLSFCGHLASMLALAALLNVNLLPFLWQFIVLSVLVVMGYSALGTLLAGVSATSRLKGMLLPLILLPLLFPLYFAALETSVSVVYQGRLDFGSFWFELLLVLDVLYILLGFNLFEFVIRE